MRFFFRRSSASASPPAASPSGAGTTIAEPPSAEDPRAETLRIGEMLLAEERVKIDTATVMPARTESSTEAVALEHAPLLEAFAPPAKDLVHASALPSAADVLAELFAEPTAAQTSRKQAWVASPVDEPPKAAPVQPHVQIAQPQIKDQSSAALSEAATIAASAIERQPAAETAARATAAEAVVLEPEQAQQPHPQTTPHLRTEDAQAPVAAAGHVAEPPKTPDVQTLFDLRLQGAPPEPIHPALQDLAEMAAPGDTDPEPAAGELCPEDAATVMAAASEELNAQEPQAQPRESAQAQSEHDGHPGLHVPLPASSSNWALEETLSSHREWIESKGVHGKKADLANAQLDGHELISVNLRLADLHYANLKSADLLLADLRDACMVRADLEEACLVGANLEGANLEGAQLETALGLVPRQLAGANLREASLPAQIAQFSAATLFRTAARAAVRFFYAIMALAAVSAVAIWKTKDIQLVTDSAILPFLHSARAAATMPSAEIFLITPVALFLLYLAFLAQIQRVLAASLELPAVFPDGSTLGEKESGIITGLLRAHFRWMNHDAPAARALEITVSLLLAYWTVPIMLFLFWARYLTLQEIHGTILHELLAAVAAGIAVHATFKVGRPQEKWVLQRTFAARIADSLRQARPTVLVGILLAIATFFSFGTIAGVPHDLSRAPEYGTANIRRWAPMLLWTVGYDPYADLTEASVSTAPAGWNGADDQLNAVRGVRLNSPRFRYAQAYGAFLVNARLWHADFRGAYLSDSDFRGADLTQSNFSDAIMDSAHLNHANLDRSILQGAHLARTDFRDANLSYAYLVNTFLMDAHFDGASLYDGQLSNSTLVRAIFDRADLRNAHVDNANLEHADFRGAYLWSASVQNSDLKDAELGSAILIGASLRNSNLSGAHFAQTVLSETDLTGAILDGADMRGAFSLTAYQVCSAHSHAGALFDDALQPQIDAQCSAH